MSANIGSLLHFRYALIDFGLAETMSKPAFLPEPKGDASKSNVIMRGKRKLDFTVSQTFLSFLDVGTAVD